jgi:hypothetical protein
MDIEWITRACRTCTLLGPHNASRVATHHRTNEKTNPFPFLAMVAAASTGCGAGEPATANWKHGRGGRDGKEESLRALGKGEGPCLPKVNATQRWVIPIRCHTTPNRWVEARGAATSAVGGAKGLEEGLARWLGGRWSEDSWQHRRPTKERKQNLSRYRMKKIKRNFGRKIKVLFLCQCFSS